MTTAQSSHRDLQFRIAAVLRVQHAAPCTTSTHLMTCFQKFNQNFEKYARKNFACGSEIRFAYAAAPRRARCLDTLGSKRSHARSSLGARRNNPKSANIFPLIKINSDAHYAPKRAPSRSGNVVSARGGRDTRHDREQLDTALGNFMQQSGSNTRQSRRSPREVRSEHGSSDCISLRIQSPDELDSFPDQQ